MWKCANVVPVHKKNEKNLKANYRPISLLSIFEKALEKLVYDSLYSHLASCAFLDPNQSGFRSGDSLITQLLSITHSVYKAFYCNPPSMLDLYILIFPKRLTGFGMLVSFINLNDVMFQANFSLSYKVFFKIVNSALY